MGWLCIDCADDDDEEEIHYSFLEFYSDVKQHLYTFQFNIQWFREHFIKEFCSECLVTQKNVWGKISKFTKHTRDFCNLSLIFA